MLDQWITVAVTLAITFIVLLVINRFFKGITKKFTSMHLNFFKSVITFIVLVVAIYSCLSQFEIAREISKTILQSGTLIIAVATFAAQAALGNVVSGFVLSSNRPCNINQYVILKQGDTVIAEGTVTDMTIRHVVIRQGDGQRAIIPNSVVDKCVIVNTNWEEHVGRMLEIQVGYDSDIALARKLILKEVKADPRAVEKERTVVSVARLADSGIVLKFGVWAKNTESSFALCSALREGIVKSFNAHHIVIPYPTISVLSASGQSMDGEPTTN